MSGFYGDWRFPLITVGLTVLVTVVPARTPKLAAVPSEGA